MNKLDAKSKITSRCARLPEAAVIVMLLFVGCWRTSEARTDLSEAQALRLFYDRNLGLLAARYNLDKTRAGEVIASAIPNPVLNLDVYELSPSNNLGFGPATSARIDQLIVTAGKRRLRMESSKLGTAASEQDLRDATRVLSNGVRKAFYRLLLAQKTQDVANDTVGRYAQIRKLNKLRFDHGDISRSDLLRIEVEGLKAQSELDKAEAELEAAQADLALLLAWPEGAMDFAAKGDWPEPVDVGQAAGSDRMLQKALNQRPDVQAAQVRVDQAEKNLSLARKLRIPDVTLGATYARDPGNPDLSTAGLGLSVPIPIFYNQKGEISQAVVDVNSAHLEVEQLTQSVRTEVIRTLAAWRSAERIVDRYRGDILNRVEDVRRSAELAYNRGATSILDLIDAQRNYRAVFLDYYTALNSRTAASADLIAVLGEEVAPKPTLMRNEYDR
jgi:outer membrane protein, heavy metal efflux system